MVSTTDTRREAAPIWTIGHSTRSLDEFLALLRGNEIQAIVDVRKFPMSRRHPQFNGDALASSLADAGIVYRHIVTLGGRRGRAPATEPSQNTYWTESGFRNYADYAATPPFSEGLAQLLDEGARQRTAMMCAEAVWWRCHRRIITDYVLDRGVPVLHVLSATKVDVAEQTPSVARRDDGSLVYRADTSSLDLFDAL